MSLNSLSIRSDLCSKFEEKPLSIVSTNSIDWDPDSPPRFLDCLDSVPLENECDCVIDYSRALAVVR